MSFFSVSSGGGKRKFPDFESGQVAGQSEQSQEGGFGLPPEVLQNIFSLLSPKELGVSALVCRAWKNHTDYLLDKIIWQHVFFGKAQWEEYLGDVGEEPPLPDNIMEILRRPSQTTGEPHKKVFQTHTLVLIPKTVIFNGEEKPLSLNLVDQLAQNAKGPRQTLFDNYPYIQAVSDQYGDKTPVEEAYWALMPRTVLPGSVGITFEEQQGVLNALNTITGDDYQVSRALEVAIQNIVWYVSRGIRLLSADSEIHTRCVENVRVMHGGVDFSGPVIVGRFDLETGLEINDPSFTCSAIGLVPCRRLYGTQ